MGGVSIAMELIADAPPVVRNAWDETEQMRKAIDKNNTTKRTTAKRLRENERQAEAFNEQLKHGGRVTGAERRELMPGLSASPTLRQVGFQKVIDVG